MELLKEITNKDAGFPEKKVKYTIREAARAVLFHREKVAMLYVRKHKYHKIPGGGIKKGEDARKGLERELLEETGCKANITGEVGKIIEYKDDIRKKQISYCFLAEVTGKGKKQYFTGLEKSQGFMLKWMEPDDAIRKISRDKPTTYDGRFIVIRDAIFLKKAKALSGLREIKRGRFHAIQNRIGDIIKKSGVEEDAKHSKLVRKWVLKMKKNAGEELQIAALAHDIDRAVKPRTEWKKGESYEKYKRRHSKRSALITADLMKEFGYDEESIAKARRLIEKHEFGGDKETNILTDADSIAYFDYNINFYLEREGAERTKKKINFMYSRASKRAQRHIMRIRFPAAVKREFKEALKRNQTTLRTTAVPPRPAGNVFPGSK